MTRAAITAAAIALAALSLAACTDEGFTVVQPVYERAPMEYSCTVSQMEKAQKEAAWCNENTSFFSSVCYGSAIMRNCTKPTTEMPL